MVFQSVARYTTLEMSYSSKRWWKIVRVIACVLCLLVGATFGILHHGPQPFHNEEAQKLHSPYGASYLNDRASADVTQDDLWTNPAAVDFGWTLEIRWDQKATRATVRRLLQNSANVRNYAVFLGFFRSPKVADFVREYGASCNPNQHLYTWLLSAYYSMPAGFGSNINTAISNFVLDYEPEVRATHRFQFVQDRWSYSFLPNYFKDLGRTVNCSFFLDASRFLSPHQPIYQRAHLNFSKSHGLFMEEGKNVIMHHASVPWKRMLLVFSQLACRDGADLIFKKKSVILKAVWQPLEGLEDVLFLLWHRLSGSSGRYIGVHIRRGDKINDEMEDLSITAYVGKLREICPEVPCPHTVFVMTDEDSAYQSFVTLAAGSYKVVHLQAVLEEIGLSPYRFIVRSPDAYIRKVPPTDRQFWSTITKQLVTEITLLAMADQIICTMSSNICQLAALLKGSHKGSVHSLDLQWDSVLY